MLSSTQNRIENLLITIDRLGIVKIKHLQEIHQLSYRNACRIVSTQLRPYIHESYFNKEKVIYLNKKGREMIASEKDEIKVSTQTIHALLRNEVYIYFQCPYDWEIEHTLVANAEVPNSFGISFQGLSLSNKKTVICDAVFKRNGYMYLVEVDNTQDMKVNKKKIEKYREVLPSYKEETPFLYFFTHTEARKIKLEEWLKGVRSKVLLYKEIK
jgi:Replication-relaxation